MLLMTENLVDFFRIRRKLKDSDPADNIENLYKKFFNLWGKLSRTETSAARKIMLTESIEGKAAK